MLDLHCDVQIFALCAAANPPAKHKHFMAKLGRPQTHLSSLVTRLNIPTVQPQLPQAAHGYTNTVLAVVVPVDVPAAVGLIATTVVYLLVMAPNVT